jgi:hypothetical protein
MTDRQKRTGYYGCKLPPGACHCPQDARDRCKHGHWIAEREVDLADVFGYGPSAPGWREPDAGPGEEANREEG